MAPDDVAAELDPELATGSWDSVFVVWNNGPIAATFGCASTGATTRQVDGVDHTFTWSTLIGSSAKRLNSSFFDRYHWPR